MQTTNTILYTLMQTSFLEKVCDKIVHTSKLYILNCSQLRGHYKLHCMSDFIRRLFKFKRLGRRLFYLKSQISVLNYILWKCERIRTNMFAPYCAQFGTIRTDELFLSRWF